MNVKFKRRAQNATPPVIITDGVAFCTSMQKRCFIIWHNTEVLRQALAAQLTYLETCEWECEDSRCQKQHTPSLRSRSPLAPAHSAFHPGSTATRHAHRHH